MIDRTQRILLIALAVQVVLIVLVFAPWSGASPESASRALVPDLARDDVARIEIAGEDEHVALSRGAGDWTVDDRDGFPADPEKVAQLLDAVVDARVRVPVVRSARYHDALGVDDDHPEARVRLADAAGDTMAEILLGTSPNVGLRHVRTPGDDRVYEVHGFERWSVRADPDAWIDKNLFPDLDAAAVRAVTVRNAHGTFAFARDDSGAWTRTPAAEGGDDLATVVRDLAGLHLLEPAGADAPTFDPAAAAATATFEVEGADGGSRTVRLDVGPTLGADDQRRVVHRTDPDRRAVVSAYEAGRVLDLGKPEGD